MCTRTYSDYLIPLDIKVSKTEVCRTFTHRSLCKLMSWGAVALITALCVQTRAPATQQGFSLALINV